MQYLPVLYWRNIICADGGHNVRDYLNLLIIGFVGLYQAGCKNK